MSHQEAGPSLYSQTLGCQEGLQAGCGLVTPSFGAIPLVQHMKRKDWKGKGREGKEA